MFLSNSLSQKLFIVLFHLTKSSASSTASQVIVLEKSDNDVLQTNQNINQTMTQPPIPVPILQNLRCGHCGKFVTCGPVYTAPDSVILCGRCVRFAKTTYRNYIFEALASIYIYPCHYWPKYCNKILRWNEAIDHEKKCLFQNRCNVFCSRPTTFFKQDRQFTPTEIKSEHISDEILQQLKCASCNKYLSNGPVHLLVDGKNICHRCVHANGPPPDSIRNLSYEAIASSMIFPCLYRFQGCTFRIQFGRDIWMHETSCPYGQTQQKLVKKQPKVVKDLKSGKERGVIETHSGHIWGTITPHSALFSPPKSRNHDGKIVTQEIEEVLKKKQQEEVKGFDVQSMDSIMSKSTFDSLDYLSKTGDNVSRDNISRLTIDNISRNTGDNVSRDNISRDNVSRDNISRDNVSRDNISRDNVSRDNISRSSSRMNMDDYRRVPSETNFDNIRRSPRSNFRASGYATQEVAPLPTPTGYNKIPHNGYYRENVNRFSQQAQLDQHLLHYPPVFYENPQNLNYSASLNNPQPHSHIMPKRSESFRVGNQDIIDELKFRQKHKESFKEDNPYKSCENLQDLVQKHAQVAN